MSTDQAGEIPVFTRGDRLRKARERMRLDQGQFADLIGVSRGLVSNYETDGTERVKPVVMKAWAMATGVSLEWLESGVGHTDPGPGHGLPADAKAERLARLAATKGRRGVSTAQYACVA